MKKNLSLVLIVVMFLTGAAIICYPFISNYVNSIAHQNAIATYKESVSILSKEDIEAELSRAQKYNESLYSNVVLTDPFDEALLAESTWEYLSLLNTDVDGIMGYIEIESIDVMLPIYHGTSSKELEKGAGHLQDSSLPVGGTGTHCIISAHTGMPSASMFDNLTKVKVGDIFILTVLGEKLAYQVDRIEVVLPDNVSSLSIDLEEDYVTLVTCTPYGVNTHRLLVRGTRIPYEADELIEEESANKTSYLWIIILIVATGITVLITIIVRKRRKKLRNARHNNDQLPENKEQLSRKKSGQRGTRDE